MKKLIPCLILFASVVIGASAFGQQKFPKEGWEPKPSPLASEFAEPGGKFSFWAAQYPKSFNYLINSSFTSYQVFSVMYETLLGQDSATLETRPGLANKWEISDDKLEYTFHIDPRAKWSDGKPVTADDVVWSFHAQKNPDHLTGQLQTLLKRLTSCEKIDDKTVKIKAKEVHWKNFTAASNIIYILPKHWWENQKFNEVHFELPVVSGPYRLGEVKEPHYARLEKREDYWNAEAASNEGIHNFDTLELRFFAQRDTAYESFKNGALDSYAIYTSSRWMKETVGERFDKNWIIKQSIYNYDPIGFQGFAMNMRRKPYDDKRVRKALAFLLDRERMNKTLMFDQYVLTKSYWPDLWNEDKPCPNHLTEFNVEEARKLFKEAGYVVNKKTGKLEKDGKPFVIKFLTRSPSSNKFLIVYQEALKDVGIDLVIDLKDQSAWSKDMDTYDYDMTWYAWGATTKKDPEPKWHSSTVDIKQGANIPGFANPKVDALIDQTREMFDLEARHDIVRQIDEVIAEETPYILLWHIDYVRMLYWNKFGTPDQVLGKYLNEIDAASYWWNDELQADDLKAARESGEAMPAPERVVRFDDIFSGGGAGSSTMPVQ